LFGTISVAFFATTARHFAGHGGATLGRRGHSKDCRPQLPQSLPAELIRGWSLVSCRMNRIGRSPHSCGLATLPMHAPGLGPEVTALLPVVEWLRRRFGVGQACVVADRGMISAATIAALEAQKIDCIRGARERSSKQVRERLLHDDGMAVPLAIPRQNGETELAVKQIKLGDRRCIICRNEAAARKDAETRVKLIAGLQIKLAQGDKSLVSNNGYRRFLAAPEANGFTIEPAKIEADAQFDGVFVLRSSLRLSAPAVVLRYRNLLAVEQSCLAAKALLATRPVLHRTDAAIRRHIFCTFIALVLRKELLDRLAARGGAMAEWRCIIDDLADLCSVEVERDGRRALWRTAPRPSIEPVCRALAVSLPPVLQELPNTDIP
jgi:hypothetical protein